MRPSLIMAVLVLMGGRFPSGAATMPTIVVTNKSDSFIQIRPIDESHKAPAPLDQITATLPPGAFIMTNQTAKPINAVVTLWSYIDKNGSSQPRKINCDGYMLVPWVNIVRANDSVLITPGGCTMREYFAHFAAGKPMLGGGLQLSRNKTITDQAGTLTKIQITVDSVIFADGTIWGPDTLHYYRTVAARHWAIQSVVEEVSNAKTAGQDLNIPLDKIRTETQGRGDEPSALRNFYAGIFKGNPTETLKVYAQQPPLPEFQHIGDMQ